MNAEAIATFGHFTPAAGGGGGGDTTPPAISIVSYPATAEDPIVLDVVEVSPGLAYLGIFCVLPGSSQELTIYRRDAFRAPFDVGSEVDFISGGLRLTVYLAGGWPAGVTTFTVDALDGDGNDEAAP